MQRNWDNFDVEAELKKIDQDNYNEHHTRKGVKKNDELAKLYNEKGKLYFQKQKYQDAMEQYQLVADTAEDSILTRNAYNNLGFCYMKLSDFKSAIPHFKKVITLEKNLKACYRLATCYEKLNMETMAIELLETVNGKDKEIDKLLLKLKSQTEDKPNDIDAEWKELPVETVEEIPSDMDEAVDLQPINTQTPAAPVIQKSEPSSIPEYNSIVVNANDLPLAKSLASLESNLSCLPDEKQRIDYLMRYKAEQYRFLFKQGIEAHHLELIIQGIQNTPNPLQYWNELKKLQRFDMGFMLVHQEFKDIANAF